MGARVGIPMMKLDRQTHYGKKNSKSGNARAIANEALEERYSSDPDLNRELTEDNQYLGYRSGNELADYWEKLADEYTVTDKNGNKKKLRADAGIAFAGIIKPDTAFMQSLSEDEQERFLDDSMETVKDMLEKRGMVLDSAVLQWDEYTPHIHFFGHDPEYKLGKKLGLPLYRALNETEYPKRMRELGWDVEALKGYDVEATKSMTDEELTEYKANHRAQKKKGGKSSAEYKADIKANQIIADAQSQADTLTSSLKAQRAVLDKKAKDLDVKRQNQEIEARNEREKLKAELEAEYQAKNEELSRKQAEIDRGYAEMIGFYGKYKDDRVRAHTAELEKRKAVNEQRKVAHAESIRQAQQTGNSIHSKDDTRQLGE